jgi:tetratricopeptide (TPR) repeat protein
MPRQQIIISVIAIIAIISLYQLPKVVVENESTADIGSKNNVEDRVTHEINLSESQQERIDQLRQAVLTAESPEKISIFADSLARSFIVFNMLDSAAKYADVISGLSNSLEYSEIAGGIYYRAFGLVSEADIVRKYGERVRELYNRVVSEEDRPDLEARIAMTYVSGSNPMQGILKLREIAEEYPDNVEAQYNLGLLGIQSAQYDKAIERFSKVIELEPDNLEGYVYLGVSYFETGEVNKAKEYFDHVINEGKDPALIELVGNYLNRIN